MPRSVVLAAALFALVPAARAEDAISPEVIRAVKRATVFIRIDTAERKSSGSGFVVAADGGTLLVMTNQHVVGRQPTVDAILDSGTRTEKAYRAEVVAVDPERDLAVLKLTGVTDAPTPVPYARPAAPFETMGVYTFGFPFGQDLAVGKGSPAVTVGRGAVSSLREREDGELDAIQIDGNLNPGNSGGPVVDAKGKLVGVAVAILREGRGIGFLVPAAEVERTMAGRVGRVRVAARTGADGKPAIRIEADLIDPAGTLRGMTAYCVLVPPKAKRPDAAILDTVPGSRKFPLKVEKGVAVAEFPTEQAAGEVMVQVVAEQAGGAKPLATRPRGFALHRGPRPEDLAGPPPDGWTDYTARDRSFAVWLPARPTRQAEQQREVDLDGQALKISSVVGETADGLAYQAEYLVPPPVLAAQRPVRLHALVRSALLDEGRGRFTESVEAVSGTLTGVQYKIEYADEVARARVFITLNGVIRLVRVVGTADQVASPEAETILQSFRLPGDRPVARGPDRPPPAGPVVPRDVGRGPGSEPTVIAGGRAPLFKDVAPAGGLLIGLEIGAGKFGPFDTITAVRPIYRVNDKEQFGTQRGTSPAAPVSLKAKDGYALGAVTCVSGLNFDGCSLTFMRVKDGKLDPADAYESDWVGQVTNKPRTRLGGDGTPVVGIAGRGTDREVKGLGLIFKGQEDFNPDVPPLEESVIAGGHAPLFKDAAPDGGLLVGLEIGLGKFFDEDVIKAVRPIYRVDGKEVFGAQRGTPPARPITLRAKEGYAVGGLSCKSGLNFDGCSLTFMRVKDGKLDPADAYESDWVGWNGNKQPRRVTGNGAPVVGIVGRGSDRELNGLGLMFKGPAGSGPTRDRR